jgi:sigma-B regulation protein RsbU (phosphoserine phosphatase)
MSRPSLPSPAGLVLLAGLGIRVVSWLLTSAGVRVPPVVTAVDVVGTLSAVVAGFILLRRALRNPFARLLWRVRRKLVISYILIGVIPALLIVAFCLLGALLVFFNFSSYLVQSRLQSMTDRADAIAQSTALDIQNSGGQEVRATLARRVASAVREFPGVSMAMVPMDRSCAPDGRRVRTGRRAIAVGAWQHLAAPDHIPEWITCDGFAGALVYVPRGDRPPAEAEGGRPVELLLRAVAFPEETSGPLYAVVVDLLVNDVVREQLRRETGVELVGLAASVGPGLAPLEGTPLNVSETAAPVDAGGTPLNWWSRFDYHDWMTGARGPVIASLRVRIGEIYRVISTEGFGGPRVGSALLVALGAVGALFLIIESAALFLGLALARSMTGAVHELFEGTEHVRRGDFAHRIAITARDQLGALATSFNSMTASIQDLLVQAAEKKRLEEELRIARGIQMSLLPHGTLEIPGISVSAVCVPAREVGGDYYDLLRLDDHRLGLLVADVAGKGTSAALYMAELKGLMLSLSRIHASPRALLVEANQIVSEHLDNRSFITMIYAVVDVKRRTLTYARAGHTPLVYIPAGEAMARVLAPDGLVLGLRVDQEGLFERLLVEQTVAFDDGDLFVLFTDGISEAMNAADDCFGEQRLSRVIEEGRRLAPEALRDRILAEVDGFVVGAPQHDDMTLIVLRAGDAGLGAA